MAERKPQDSIYLLTYISFRDEIFLIGSYNLNQIKKNSTVGTNSKGGEKFFGTCQSKYNFQRTSFLTFFCPNGI